jgi:hypothetical protein
LGKVERMNGIIKGHLSLKPGPPCKIPLLAKPQKTSCFSTSRFTW